MAKVSIITAGLGCLLFKPPEGWKILDLDIGRKRVNQEYANEFKKCKGNVIIVNHHDEDGNTLPTIYFEKEIDYLKYATLV